MRWIISLVVFAGTMGSAAAQPADSVVTTVSLLMGCRALVENDPTGDMMQIGACAGAVRATLDISRAVGKVCPPADGGVLESARVVIMFVDEKPERRSEHFGPLAMTALGYRWPCPK
jgi:hypothetical protein